MLGVMFSIPLRHVMVVQSELPYPERGRGRDSPGGQRRARSGSAGRRRAGQEAKPAATGMADIAAGGVVAAAVSFAASGLRVLGESVSGWFALGGAVFRLPMGFRWRCWAPAT